MNYRRVPTDEANSSSIGMASDGIELADSRINIPSRSNSSLISITLIRVGSGSHSSIPVSVDSGDTLTQLKHSVFPSEASAGRLIRFIYSGRVLYDESQRLKDLQIQPDTCLHVHIGPPPEESERKERQQTESFNHSNSHYSSGSGSSSSPASSVSRRSASASASHIASQSNSDDSSEVIFIDSNDPGTSWRVSNSSEDSQIPPQPNEFSVNNGAPDLDQEERNWNAQLEAQEMGEREEFNRLWHQARIEGGTRDLIVGFILGSFLGILAVIWLWHSGSTRKMRIGILIGISTSFLGTYFRIGSEEQKKVASNRPSEEDPDPLQPLPIR